MARLFAKIGEMVEDDDCLVFILIDEVCTRPQFLRGRCTQRRLRIWGTTLSAWMGR